MAFRILVLTVLVAATTLSATAQFKLYEQGIDFYKKNEFEKAINSFNEYLDKPVRDKKMDVDVRYYLALAYYKSNSMTSAIREFDEALKMNHPNVFNIHWFMAKAYSSLKLYKEAVAEYSASIAKGTDNKANLAKVYAERGQLYEKMNAPGFAKEDSQAALALDPSNADAKKLVEAQPAPVVAKVVQESTPQPELDRSAGTEVKTTAEKVSQPVATTQPVPQPVEPEELSLEEQYKDEKRYALVIGNGAYQFVPPLKNSVNDATDVANALEQSGFEVIRVIDGTYEQMRDAFKKFHANLSNGPRDKTVGLFYYAGHGLQSEGENYIVPVSANIQFDDDIPRTCLPVQRVILTNMERSNSRMNIVILDACRNNPFPASSRSAENGLSEMKKAKGSFIAYATAPGSTASDGTGRNGLYTQELLKAMTRKGRTIEQVFKEVRQNVLRLSNGVQNTWDSSNIIGEFYFKF